MTIVHSRWSTLNTNEKGKDEVARDYFIKRVRLTSVFPPMYPTANDSTPFPSKAFLNMCYFDRNSRGEMLIFEKCNQKKNNKDRMFIYLFIIIIKN